MALSLLGIVPLALSPSLHSIWSRCRCGASSLSLQTLGQDALPRIYLNKPRRPSASSFGEMDQCVPLAVQADHHGQRRRTQFVWASCRCCNIQFDNVKEGQGSFSGSATVTGTSSSASQVHTDTVRSDRDKRQLRLEQEEQGPLKKGTCLPERQHAKFCIGIGQ